MRYAERNARAKYEALQPSASERVAANSTNASPESRTSKAGVPSRSRSQSSRLSHKTSLLKGTEELSNASAKSLPPQRSSSNPGHSVSTSARASSSNISRSSSRNKPPCTIAPEETARRAAYHAKLSKLHEEDKKKRSARAKRLFESALRTLVSEGELTLFDGPRRRVPSLNGLAGEL
ncbi:hypothetical protein RSAG8_01569, partial [Rhizoctonia solani AG-8 WAC10335]